MNIPARYQENPKAWALLNHLANLREMQKGIVNDETDSARLVKDPLGVAEQLADYANEIVRDLRSIDGGSSFDELTESVSRPLDEFTHLIDSKIEYTIYPICPKGTLTLLQGQPKLGKSTFASWLAACAAMGSWNGDILKIDRPLKTLFVEYEDDILLVVQRIASYLEGAGLDRYSLPKNFIYCDNPILWLDSPAHEDALIEEIKKKSYDLVVIDTLSDVHNAENENDSAQMKLVMKALKRVAKATNISIILIHHSKKGSEGTSIAERARGSSMIAAKADILLDWGDRGDTDITPLRIGGKYGFKATCEVEYVRKDERAVEWVLRDVGSSKEKVNLDGILKGKPTHKKIQECLQTLFIASPKGVPGKQIVAVMADQGMSKSTVYRLLGDMVSQGVASQEILGKSTIYKLTGV